MRILQRYEAAVRRRLVDRDVAFRRALIRVAA